MPSTRLKVQMPLFYEILYRRWEPAIPTLRCAAQARCAQAEEGAVRRKGIQAIWCLWSLSYQEAVKLTYY